jgi:hypothetical protein
MVAMTRRSRSPTPAVLGGEKNGRLRHLGGSQSDVFNSILLNTLLQTDWRPKGQSEEDQAARLSAAVIAMGAFKPADEIEAMLAAQAIAMHHASMECSRRAMLNDQPFEVAQGLRKAAATASRTFSELLSALDRKRGKGGQQRVVVEHVHVHSGGQAIVGAVASGGGGDESKMQAEPGGAPPKLAHDPAVSAVLPPLRSQNPKRQPLPLAGNAREEAVPLARRQINRTTNGGGN